MRTLVLLLLLPLLAGCAAEPATPPPQEDAPAAPREVALDLSDCLVLEAILPVPAQTVRPYVPDAFRLVESNGRANVVLGGFSCKDVDASGIVAFQVEPLEESLRPEHVDRHFWRPEVDVPKDAPLAGAYAQVGANVTLVEDVVLAFGLGGGSMRVQAENWTHRVTFAPSRGPPPADALVGGVAREWSAAEGGFSWFDSAWTSPQGASFAAAVATFETGEGTPARALLGASGQAPAIFLTGVAYAEPKVGFVPAP